MFDPNQLEVPESFATLYVAPGQIKPSLDRESLYARYELCEDLAASLSEQARATMMDMGIAESDVLERYYAGMTDDQSGLQTFEAGWIIRRVTEMSDWPASMADFVDHQTTPSSSSDEISDDE